MPPYLMDELSSSFSEQRKHSSTKEITLYFNITEYENKNR